MKVIPPISTRITTYMLATLHAGKYNEFFVLFLQLIAQPEVDGCGSNEVTIYITTSEIPTRMNTGSQLEKIIPCENTKSAANVCKDFDGTVLAVSGVQKDNISSHAAANTEKMHSLENKGTCKTPSVTIQDNVLQHIKSKKHRYTLSEKMAAIEYAEKIGNTTQAGSDLGIPESNIRLWKKSKMKIEEKLVWETPVRKFEYPRISAGKKL